MKLILASNSPRRRELLALSKIEFNIVVSDFLEEEVSSNPVETAEKFAFGKAESVFASLKDDKDYSVVLGADTVVFLNGEILGKPQNEVEARKMLKKLSGKTHTVVTGYCIISKDSKIIGNDQTKVTFNNLSDELIDEYISSGLYKGKSGSYGIQDGFPLVERYEGSLSNVIGLPTEKVVPIIKSFIK